MNIFTRALCALFIFSFALTARSQQFDIDPADKQITIKGFAGDDTSFTSDIRVTLRDSNATSAAKLRVLPSHLLRTDGNEEIKRDKVDVGKEIALTANVPTSVPIKITSVKAPGEYKGKLELYFADQSQSTAQSVDITVIARVRPALTALTNASGVKASLVNCESPCWLARWLLPGSTQRNYELRFEKPIGAPQVDIETAMDVKGERNGFQWKSNHLQFGHSAATTTTDQRFLTIPVVVSYSDLPADHYTGSLYLSLGSDTPVIKLPVDINVRVAPLWPLLLLAIGILLGKLVKFMQEKGGPAADAQLAFNRIESRLLGAHMDDQEILSQRMKAVDRLINENQSTEATAMLKLIKDDLDKLESLRTTEGRLVGKEQHPKVRDVLAQIRQAREYIRQGDKDQANLLATSIAKAVVDLSTTLMGEDAPPDRELQDAGKALKMAADSSRTASIDTRPLRGNKVTRSIAKFSGVVDDLRAETALIIFRPLLWFVLLLGLIALGMKSLYIDNPTFGTSAVDYISLIFWGMSSDVASRALGSLKFA